MVITPGDSVVSEIVLTTYANFPFGWTPPPLGSVAALTGIPVIEVKLPVVTVAAQPEAPKPAPKPREGVISGRVLLVEEEESVLASILLAFLEAPLRALTREHLLRATRVHEDIFDRSIDVQVLRLRRKLEIDPNAPRMIQTERGIGYVFALPVERF